MMSGVAHDGSYCHWAVATVEEYYPIDKLMVMLIPYVAIICEQ
jgi:hypothetical protein